MFVLNFNILDGLEVAEKFVVVGGEHMTTVSNSSFSCFRVVLSCVALGFDKSYRVKKSSGSRKIELGKFCVKKDCWAKKCTGKKI